MTWLIAAAGLAILWALGAWGASKLFYYPFRYPAGDWAAQGRLGAQDVWLTTRDGVRVHCWLVRHPNSQLLTLHLHGNGGNITHREEAARTILAAGSSVLLVDYRGYGKSEGRPSERGLYSDADAAWLWATGQANYPPKHVVAHGESLGTAVAVQLSAERRIAAVVLEAPFTSARAMAHRAVPFIGPALVWGFDSLRTVRTLKVPVLFVHGDQDEVVPFALGRELYEAAGEPKQFLAVKGAGHNDLHLSHSEQIRAALAALYSRLSDRS